MLAELGVADEVELAARIRDGTLAAREEDLLAGLRAIVRAKLEVANPAYPQEPRNPSRQEET